MHTLKTMLQAFFKENEWNINKLKDGDVIYYIEENINTDNVVVLDKEQFNNDSHIDDYGQLIINKGSITEDILLNEDDAASILLKSLTDI